LIEDVHSEKDLQRHFAKLSHALKAKYNYPMREVVGFSYVQNTLQVITMEKFLEISKADLKFMNSFHFLSPT